TKTITVRVFNRGNVNFNVNSTRDFFVRLSNPRNASISDGEGRGTIRSSGINTFGSSGCLIDSFGNCTSTGILGGFGTGVNINDNASCTEGILCSFTITTSFTTVSAISGTSRTPNGSAVGGAARTGRGGPDYWTAA